VGKLRIALAALILLAVPAVLTASEGLDVPEALEKTVSVEGLTGISLLVVQAYNDNAWLYAVYCTASMGVVGMVIAFLADRILKAIGMQVNRIEHRE
jgi:hypothetical protein